MHTIFIRGVLLRLARGPRRAWVFAQQIAGAVGGWASSVRQQVPSRRAPLSNLLASAARAQLDHGSFVDFCRFNVDAERTASACWARITELAGAEPSLPAGLAEAFALTKADEDRHERVFRALSESLDDDDRLRAGLKMDELAARLAEIGPFFLPPDRRPRPPGEPAPRTCPA